MEVFLPRRVDTLLATAKMYDAQTDLCKFLSLVPPIIAERKAALEAKMSPIWTTKNLIAPQCSPQKKIFDAVNLLQKNLKKLRVLDRKMAIQRLFQVIPATFLHHGIDCVVTVL